MAHQVTILNESTLRRIQAPLRRALTETMNHCAISEFEINVLVTDNARLRVLNHQFLGLDSPTDVLTFPGMTVPGADDACRGDIAISAEMATVQASMRRVAVTHELQMLAIHGGLHLAGLDDQDEQSRNEMVSTMNEIAIRLNIPEDRIWWSRHYGVSA